MIKYNKINTTVILERVKKIVSNSIMNIHKYLIILYLWKQMKKDIHQISQIENGS